MTFLNNITRPLMKKNCSYLLLTFCVLLFLSQMQIRCFADDFAGGVGTKEEPYLIENPAQLGNMQKYTGDKFSGVCFQLKCDIKFKKSDFESGGDFYNDAKGWEPVGVNTQQSFQGVFDGNGKKIEGLVLSKRAIGGLFGFTQKATIKNVSLKNCFFSVETDDPVLFLGGIAGCVEDNFIEHCQFEGQLKYRTGRMARIGGIVGDSRNTSITCCSTKVRVNGDCFEKRGDVILGGILGSGWIKDQVINCCADVAIESTGPAAIGGIAGIMHEEGKIENSYATGSIVGQDMAAGIVACVGAYFRGWNCVSLMEKLIVEKQEGINRSGVGRILGQPKTFDSLNNWASNTMVLEGRTDSINSNIKGQDGMTCSDYKEQSFWEKRGFVFGDNAKAPWCFDGGLPQIYGFATKSKSALNFEFNTDLRKRFKNLYDVYHAESKKGQSDELKSNYRDYLLEMKKKAIADKDFILGLAIKKEMDLLD